MFKEEMNMCINQIFYLMGGEEEDRKYVLLELSSYLLYNYVSMVYEKDMKRLRAETDDLILIEKEKQNLRFQMEDDWSISHFASLKTDDIFVEKYKLNLMKISIKNIFLLDLLYSDDLDYSAGVLKLLFNKLNFAKFKDETEIVMLFDCLMEHVFFKNNEVSYLSRELKNLIKKIGYDDSVKTVYDNAVGFGNLFDFEKDVEFYGNDIIKENVILCKTNLILHNKNADNIYCRDSIKVTDDELYDLVVSEPPFDYKIDRNDPRILTAMNEGRFRDFNFSKFKNDNLFIEDGIQHLKPNCKGFFVIAQGSLYRQGNDKIYRKYLVDNNLIEGIISFPSGALNNTGIASAVLIIKKNKSDNKIKLLDASGFFKKEERGRSKDLSRESIEKIIDIYNNQKETDEIFAVVTNEEVKRKNYELSFMLYVKNDFSVNYDFENSKNKINILAENVKESEISLERKIKEIEKIV